MKTMKYLSEGLAAFSAVVLLSHLGTAYGLFRLGIVWIFGLSLVSAIAYGLILIALSMMQQSRSENSDVSPVVAFLSATPAAVLLILIVAGGLTGILTGWI